MLHSHFKFTYVLFTIFISSVLSVSFGDFCSNDLSCHYPLICSNSSKCICPITLPPSFWNRRQNTCLSCPSESMEWKNEKCLLFISPYQGGVIYSTAKSACSIYSAQLLQIKNYQDFFQLQYKIDELFDSENANAFIDFLNNGVWINFTDSINSYDWCDMKYENEISSWNKCVRVMKNSSKNNNTTSLCISHVHCHEKLPYICEKSAQIQGIENDLKYQERASVFGELISDLLYPMSESQTTQQPQSPQILYLTASPQKQQQILAQIASSNSTTHYIIFILGFIFLICLLFCCGVGGYFLWRQQYMSNASLSSNYNLRQHRTSIDSTSSGTT